jgi:hypothetical protein
MKIIKHLSITGLILIIGLNSCTIEKRLYMRGYHIVWHKNKHNINKPNVTGSSEVQTSLIKQQQPTITNELNTNLSHDNENTNSLLANKGNVITHSKDNRNKSVKTNNNILLNKTLQDNSKKIVELRKLSKSFFLKARTEEPQTNKKALWGFIFSLVGLIIFGIIFGILAIIFSAIGFADIKKDPTKWKGMGLAIAGIIIGVIDVIGWIIIVAVLL